MNEMEESLSSLIEGESQENEVSEIAENKNREILEELEL